MEETKKRLGGSQKPSANRLDHFRPFMVRSTEKPFICGIGECFYKAYFYYHLIINTEKFMYRHRPTYLLRRLR